MSTFRTDYFPPSNRRRCVKGRSSYTESSDLYLSSAVNQDQNSIGFSQNEDSYNGSVQSDDGEEEDITIDLSAFLNDNPLLAQAAFESASENNVASTESSSQFRVTDCKVDPSEIPKTEVTDTLFSVNVNGDTSVDTNIINDNVVIPYNADSVTFDHKNAKENCPSPEKILTNLTNSEPAQSIVLNGKKTLLSPTKKFSKALGLSNPLKKYKNFMKAKDLNKVNEKVFGKYPIVKCEKLDIENFVKNNKIKIRNWPFTPTENQKDNIAKKDVIKKKVNLDKSTLKPKFIKKPINFNKYLIVSNKNSTNQSVKSILADQSDSSKPIIIKTDSWKPGVANVSPHVSTFFRPLTKTTLSTSKNVVCDVLKFNDKTVSLNVISSPEKKCDIRTNTIAKNINNLFSSPKSYPFIAPKLPNIHSLTTTKPVIETLTASTVDKFTVIEPYIDDPISPQKSNPVPIEVVSSPEKQNYVLSSTTNSIISSVAKDDNPEKMLKADKSVFLNGEIKKITLSSKTKKDTSDIKEVIYKKNNQENILNEVTPKIPAVLKVKDIPSEENSSVLKAKNIVLDAMQSAFSTPQIKKSPKARSVKKPAFDLTPENSLLGSSAYSSLLNDNILNGFSENDFEDVSFFEEDFVDVTDEILSSRKSIPVKVNMAAENSVYTPKSIKKARERKKYRRKKSLEDSSETNSSLSASDFQNEDKLMKDKKIILTPESNTVNIKSSTVVNNDFDKSVISSVHSKSFNESMNKNFETKHVDSSLLFSNSENYISELQDNVNYNKCISSKKVEQIEVPSFNEKIVPNVVSPIKKNNENNNLLKQETSTRTLRNRKCSSTEVKNFNAITKQNSHEKISPDKNKIKGSINSKLKIQLKTPKNSSKVKLKKNSCKSEDIIQEINTITGRHSISKKGSFKNKKPDLEKDIKNSDSSNINVQNESESDSSNMSLSSQPSLCPLSKRKTLKVSIKRSKRKNASCLKIPLNTLSDVVDNANNSNSVSESNLSLHSSFREAKDEKIGTLQREENSTVNSSPIPDCNMENSNEKLDQMEEIPGDAPDLMVNPSETTLLEDNSNINSDVNTISDKFIVIENKDNSKDLVKQDNKLGAKEQHPLSSVDDIRHSENYLENSESLIVEDNNIVTEISPFLTSYDLKETVFSSEDLKNSETDSKSCEFLIKEKNIEVIEVLPAMSVENSKDITLTECDSVELTNKTLLSNIIDKNIDENLHSICDVPNSDMNQNNEKSFKANVTVCPETSVENEVLKEDIPEQTIIKEKVTIENEIGDDSELISVNPDIDANVDNKAEQVNPVSSIESLDKSSSPSKNYDVVEETMSNSNEAVHNKNQTDVIDIHHQDDSTFVETETLIAEVSTNKSNDIIDNEENASHKFSEKCEDHFENAESSLLKSVKNKTECLDETNTFTDISNNCNKNNDDILVNEVNLNISCSNTVPEKEISLERNSTKDNQKSVVQIDKSLDVSVSDKEILPSDKDFIDESKKPVSQTSETSINVFDISHERFLAKTNDVSRNADELSCTTHENKILPSKKESRKSKKLDNIVKSKKCPKIKISFKKPDGDSPNSFKKWFVSGSEETDVKSSITSEVFEAKPDNSEKPDLSVLSILNDPVSAINNSENHESIDKSNATSDSCTEESQTSSKLSMSSIDTSSNALPEKTIENSLHKSGVISSESNSLSNDIVLTKTTYECQSFEKINNSSSKETSLLDDNVSSDGNINNNCTSEEEEIECVDTILIKEEPMDIEENIVSETKTNSIIQETTIKIEPSSSKRKRGRPRKSMDNCNMSLTFDKDKVILKQEEATISDTPEVKQDEVIPKRNAKNTPARNSTGQKKKSNQMPGTTPSSGRRKNYDPELVCVPFSMGWMREHVIRAAGKDDKRQSDIYYFSPEGTKLRSMPDIQTYLSKHPHIKLSAVNFTFAKELIYREPFEIERDAKQPSCKKVCAAPTPKKSPKTPSKALISPAENPSDTPSVTELKKNVAVKRKRSLKVSDLPTENKDNTLNTSDTCKRSKRLSLDTSVEDNSKKTEDKSERSSRRIAKKISFDNSLESPPSKKVKLTTVVTRKSSGNTKTDVKSESKEKESLVLKIPVKSPPSNITKENKLPKSEISAEVTENKLNVNKSSNTTDKLSSKKRKKSKPSDSPNVIKPSCAPEKSQSPSENISDASLLSRTNIKSPVIQKRLKVKLGSKKPELMHKPCTKFCNFSYVRVPSIQCCVCLCLFHPECIPFKPTGLNKYACVPCVTTKIGSHTEMLEDLIFPDDFNFELLYPSIFIQISKDPNFDAIYNKFYSPVDSSFIQVTNVSTSHQRPLKPYIPYCMNNNSFNPLHSSTSKQNSVVWSPLSTQTVAQSGFLPISNSGTFQKSPNVNVQKMYATNHSSSNLMPIKIVNPPGSLPMLQNFSNAFFVQNQPFSNPSSIPPSNIQNPFQLSSTNDNIPLGTFTKADGSKVHQTLVVQKFPINRQIGGSVTSGNVQNIASHTKSISVLQTMLQSKPELTNKSFKVVQLNDYSTLKISGNNIPSPLSINITSENNASKQPSGAISAEPANNKKEEFNNSDSTSETLNCNQLIISKNFTQPSSSPLKISNVYSFSEQLSTCWDMNKFAQIYECLNFIFKFLNVSDLLCASLVCKSWNHLATQKLLWENVSFSGIYIKDWLKCCKTIQKHGTKCIDFRGLYNQDSDDCWRKFLENVNRLIDIEEFIFEKVPPYVISKISDSLPQLRKLTCFCLTSVFTEPEIWSTPCDFELATLRCLGRLEALKISSMGGIHLKDNQLSLLPYLPNLTHLVLSGFKFNSCMNLESLSQMQQLITLELGDCNEIEPQIYGLLSQLTNLENLCLQNGGDVNDKKLSEALMKLNNLKTLELMNFQLSCHLPSILRKMNTLCYFSLWPDSRLNCEQVHFNSFKAATSCPSLKKLCWGILTDDETVPIALEMRDSNQNKTEITKMSYEELFQSLVKHNPGVKVELKCLPRSIWSEYCSTRNFM